MYPIWDQNGKKMTPFFLLKFTSYQENLAKVMAITDGLWQGTINDNIQI